MQIIKQGFIIRTKLQPYLYKSNTLTGISDKIELAFICRNMEVAETEIDYFDIPSNYEIKPITITYEIGE